MQPGPPSLASIVHVALTVADLDRSVRWYETVLGVEQVVTVPHEGGEGVVLATPDRAVWLALHRHDGNDGARFSEVRTGLDHVALLVSGPDELQRWATWFGACGVGHDGVRPLPDFGMAALVVRDPDGIPLELLAYT
jgi:glyoxylase I family protein